MAVLNGGVAVLKDWCCGCPEGLVVCLSYMYVSLLGARHQSFRTDTPPVLGPGQPLQTSSEPSDHLVSYFCTVLFVVVFTCDAHADTYCHLDKCEM